jgi:hypothetical protein
MFLAQILFCFISYDGIRCIEAEDTKGPYQTHQECLSRVAEMSHVIKIMHPTAVVRGYRCETGEET